MEIYRSRQIKAWVDDLVAKAKAGDGPAVRMARHVYDEFTYLKELEEVPTEDTATLKRVRQSRRHTVWRLSHPFDPEMAVRVICWFDTETGSIVVVLFAANKAPMGDVFYDSVGTRADQAIEEWKRERDGGKENADQPPAKGDGDHD